MKQLWKTYRLSEVNKTLQQSSY